MIQFSKSFWTKFLSCISIIIELRVMHSIMYPNISSEPILGILVIILILVCLFAYTGIYFSEIFTTDGFVRILNEKPWVIYLAIGVTLYALVSIWTSQRASYQSNVSSEQREKLENVSISSDNLMTFDSFFKKYFVTEPETPGDIAPAIPNTYMVLRTKVDGQTYCLIMSRDTEQNIYSNIPENSNRKEVMPRPCKITIQGTDYYVRPVLMREDILNTLYKNYISTIKTQISSVEKAVTPSTQIQGMGSESGGSIQMSLNLNSVNPASVDTFDGTIGGIIDIKGNMFSDHVENFLGEIGETLTTAVEGKEQPKQEFHPRFIHHFDMQYKLGSPATKPSGDNAPKTPAYMMRGMHSEQVLDLSKVNLETPYIVSAIKSLWVPNNAHASPDDAIFLCGNQLPSTAYGPDTIYSESYAPLLEDVTANKSEQSTSISSSEESSIISSEMTESITISDPSSVSEHEKLASRVNFYLYKDGKKYYFARLKGFKIKKNQPKNKSSSVGTRSNVKPSVLSQTSTESDTSSSEESMLHPEIIPIGLVPEKYTRPEFLPVDSPDYGLGEKLDFEVVMVRLSQLH